jgi:hypothetical protein
VGCRAWRCRSGGSWTRRWYSTGRAGRPAIRPIVESRTGHGLVPSRVPTPARRVDPGRPRKARLPQAWRGHPGCRGPGAALARSGRRAGAVRAPGWRGPGACVPSSGTRYRRAAPNSPGCHCRRPFIPSGGTIDRRAGPRDLCQPSRRMLVPSGGTKPEPRRSVRAPRLRRSSGPATAAIVQGPRPAIVRARSCGDRQEPGQAVTERTRRAARPRTLRVHDRRVP